MGIFAYFAVGTRNVHRKVEDENPMGIVYSVKLNSNKSSTNTSMMPPTKSAFLPNSAHQLARPIRWIPLLLLLAVDWKSGRSAEGFPGWGRVNDDDGREGPAVFWPEDEGKADGEGHCCWFDDEAAPLWKGHWAVGDGDDVDMACWPFWPLNVLGWLPDWPNWVESVGLENGLI